MFITAKLVFEYYIPAQLTKGMWFKQRIKDIIYGRIYEYDRLYELNHIPVDMDTWVQANGYPVRPRIVSYTANPDEPAETLATYDKIGWWDEGPHAEELRDIEIKDFNVILSDFDSEIQIDVEEATIESSDGTATDDVIIPIIYADKVTLRMPMEEEDYDDDYDDYEDMDWEDDEPEEDSAGFTEQDRCIKYPQTDSDHETE